MTSVTMTISVTIIRCERCMLMTFILQITLCKIIKISAN